jgi:hypothetical protein
MVLSTALCESRVTRPNLALSSRREGIRAFPKVKRCGPYWVNLPLTESQHRVNPRRTAGRQDTRRQRHGSGSLLELGHGLRIRKKGGR